ncbi:IS3 family transposase [Candidatus Uabimicrobium sp. HlEnr_7]
MTIFVRLLINKAKEVIYKYIEFYNNERLHQSLDYATEVYFSKRFAKVA